MPRTVETWAVRAAPAAFVVLWASGFIGARLGMPHVEPLTFLTLRMGAVVVLIAGIIVASRPPWPGGRAIGHAVVAGLLVHGLYLGGVFVAISDRLPAGLAALIVGLQPVLTSTVANRFLGERVRPLQWLGLALGLVGVFLVVQDKAVGGGTGALAWPAVVLALFGITAGTLYQKRFGGGMDWRSAFLVQYSAAGTLFLAGAMLFESRAVEWAPGLLFALAWLVLVVSLGAIWLLYFLIRRTAATRVASLFYLTPPTTALMAWAMFDEQLGVLPLVGMALCVTAVVLVNRPAAGPSTGSS